MSEDPGALAKLGWVLESSLTRGIARIEEKEIYSSFSWKFPPVIGRRGLIGSRSP